MSDLFDGAPRTKAFAEELSRSYLNGSGKYGSMREFAVQLERQHTEALALLRELNDALGRIGGYLRISASLQARVDAVLDRAEESMEPTGDQVSFTCSSCGAKMQIWRRNITEPQEGKP